MFNLFEKKMFVLILLGYHPCMYLFTGKSSSETNEWCLLKLHLWSWRTQMALLENLPGRYSPKVSKSKLENWGIDFQPKAGVYSWIL